MKQEFLIIRRDCLNILRLPGLDYLSYFGVSLLAENMQELKLKYCSLIDSVNILQKEIICWRVACSRIPFNLQCNEINVTTNFAQKLANITWGHLLMKGGGLTDKQVKQLACLNDIASELMCTRFLESGVVLESLTKVSKQITELISSKEN